MLRPENNVPPRRPDEPITSLKNYILRLGIYFGTGAGFDEIASNFHADAPSALYSGFITAVALGFLDLGITTFVKNMKK